MKPAGTAPRRYVTLDGLRGVAAVSILLLHLERPGFHMPPGAYTAVDLFFLISGFVIPFSIRPDSQAPAISFLM